MNHIIAAMLSLAVFKLCQKFGLGVSNDYVWGMVVGFIGAGIGDLLVPLH